MQYGTPTTLKSIYSYMPEPFPTLSKKAALRLKWMDYIYRYGHSVAGCSRHFDYPERTIRYWKKRYNLQNFKSLEDKSKRPKNTRTSEIDLDKVKRVLQLRRKYGRGQSRIQKTIN